jgi:hypothetical protein
VSITDLLTRFPTARKSGTGWQTRCPAHKDRNPSLSISEGRNGGVLVHCHAGCPTEAVLGAVGLTLADLANGNDQPKTAARTIVDTYDYHDADAKLLFQVVRYAPKDFRQRRPDGNGGWIWKMEGVRRVPFRLPQVIAAVKRGQPVYICEGEKDCLAMERAGFCATTNPGGAGKWLTDYAPPFKGAAVVVIADKDDPGRHHAQAVARELHGTAASVKVLEVPDVDGKPCKDAADFLSAGGQAADLDELMEKAPAWEVQSAECGMRSGECGANGSSDPWLALVEDGADMQVQALPPVIEIVQGIVAEFSKLSVASSAKSYKTWLTLHMALAIAHGADFLGRQTTRRKVLYVNLELKPATFTRRLQAIAKHLGIAVDRTWFRHLPLRGKLARLTVHEIVSRIIALARQVDAAVVILDPLFKLNIEGEENSSRDQTVFLNELDRITTEGHCTAIFNDHSGKGNQSEKDPLDVIRGSSAKGGDLDAAMVLRKHEVEHCFRVDMVHRELPPVEPFTVGWHYPVMELRPDLDLEAMKKPGAGRKREHDPRKLLAAIMDRTADNPISISGGLPPPAWCARACKGTCLNCGPKA